MLTRHENNNFRNNEQERRFELTVEGEVVFANYKIENSILYINYVEAPPKLRGSGAASKLMDSIVSFARDSKYRIVPICAYAASWLRRHEEHQDILA